ncbi:MAG: DUF86 domain-containing protein [Candidatus Rokubacteria bacterium]|nr:DUF86 domain-containing protein [Candidatus Rokubacteria bacterium]
MTRGPINLKVVAERLEIVARCLDDLRAVPSSSFEEFQADRRNPAAAESLLRRAIEALFDTARHLLARAFGIGGLEYREVARLAAERGLVVDPALCDKYVEIAGFRTRLTHFYGEVTTEELFGVVANDLADLERLAEELRAAAARLASR